MFAKIGLTLFAIACTIACPLTAIFFIDGLVEIWSGRETEAEPC